MPLITTRFHKMWTNFKQSVPNLGEERIYLTRCVSFANVAQYFRIEALLTFVPVQVEAVRRAG